MIVFLFKLTLAWGLFALIYALLLRQETFFRANRAYLLGTAALGIVLALPVHWLAAWQGEAAPTIAMLPGVTVGLRQAEQAAYSLEWFDFLWLVYGLGAVLALFRMLWGLLRIARMIVRGIVERLPDGCVLVQTTETKVPFSFFKWVFVPYRTRLSESRNLAESYANDAMLAHERAHAHDWHSADVIIIEILCVVFWFHPLAHWYRRTIRAVHEFLADAEASRQTDRKRYGLLLIRQAQSGVSLAFVNHFFQSPLRQRLIMLTRNASPALRAWKYGLFLPVFVFLFLLACQKTAGEQTDPKSASDRSTDALTVMNDKYVFDLFEVDRAPQFPGGTAALTAFLIENIRYPDEARSMSAEGMVAIAFVVDKNGAVTEAEGIKTEQNGWRQDFQDEAVRVVQSMPRWEPAVSNGKPVKVKFTLPIRFRLK